MKRLIKTLLRENLKNKSKVYLVHGFEGDNKNHWFPWVENKLKDKGFEVKSLAMPSPKEPNLDDWVQKIKNEVGSPNNDTHFIGHSLGCLAIIEYIKSLNKNESVGKCVFVSGFLKLDDDKMKTFYQKKFNSGLIKDKVKSITIIYSDNDEEITVKQSEKFGEVLNAKKILLKNKGHFTTEDGVTKIPEIIKIFN